MLDASADADFTVCDPFVGSGSAAIAALEHKCRFVGADISEEAVQLARGRCEAYIATGVDPLERRRV
jgi:site-specific DNA-methyltransferase (adenine-specific)